MSTGPTRSLSIRLPTDLHQRLHASATDHGRSLNAEAISVLNRGIEGGAPLRHATVRLQPPPGLLPSGDKPVDIDEGLAPIISELWSRDIPTWMCCQYDTYYQGAIINFWTAEDMTAFISAVLPAHADPVDDVLAGRVRDWEVAVASPSTKPGAWQFIVAPDLYGDEWTLTANVVFPVADIPEIARRLQERPVTQEAEEHA